MPATFRTIHFIGIGGAGMSAIAKVLLEAGYDVTGSDLKWSDATQRLSTMGATINVGHREENLQNPDVVVVSSAIPMHNVELVAAKARGILVMQRGEMLAQLMSQRKGIAIAGAHGKTTTTSMVSLVMERAGLDPTVLIGGELNDIGGNAKSGQGEYLVAEADESDGSFLKLLPHIVVVTNVEDDHLDYYGSLDNIITAFRTFVDKVPTDGLAIFCSDNVNAATVANLASTKRRVTYGFNSGADYQARNLSFCGFSSTCEVWEKGRFLGLLQLLVPGRHSILNALATVAVAREVGVDFKIISEALASFHGVHRRFELLGKVNDIYVVDDYGHHPTEIKATLSAANQREFNRIICVFQPHRYTRTKFLHREFGEAFDLADLVIVTDIYAAGEQPIAGVSANLIIDSIKAHAGPSAVHVPDLQDVVSYLTGVLQPGDLVLTMGAGNVSTIGNQLVKALSQKAPVKQAIEA
ncbi:MAG: UDP-N-acetylmuramate--L-alanine ligase [bacterium]|jgi:UDP-N-acetylmuramate--alanine ligase